MHDLKATTRFVGRWIAVLLLICLSLKVAAQEEWLRGKVYDEDMLPLPVTLIKVVGTTRGVTSELDGSFEVNMDGSKELLFSFVGYRQFKVNVERLGYITIQMKEKEPRVVSSMTRAEVAKLQKNPITLPEPPETNLAIERIRFPSRHIKAGSRESLTVVIKNRGNQEAVNPRLILSSDISGLGFSRTMDLPNIASNSEKSFLIDLQGAESLKTGEGILSFRLEADNQKSGFLESFRLQTVSAKDLSVDRNRANPSGMPPGARPGDLLELKNGKYYALLIGVQDYSDPALTDLKYPVSDVEQLKSALVRNYTFNEQQVLVLKNPTESEIIGGFNQIRQLTNESDNVLIFYAGHGYWNQEEEQGYWLPSDAEKSNTSNWVSNSTIRDKIRSLKNQHTLLITDACFSGSFFHTREFMGDESPATIESLKALYKLKSRRAITSGTKNQVVPDKSLFIEYFLRKLKTHQGQVLRSRELFNFILEPMVRYSRPRLVPQEGVIAGTDGEGGDFVFLKRN